MQIVKKPSALSAQFNFSNINRVFNVNNLPNKPQILNENGIVKNTRVSELPLNRGSAVSSDFRLLL